MYLGGGEAEGGQTWYSDSHRDRFSTAAALNRKKKPLRFRRFGVGKFTAITYIGSDVRDYNDSKAIRVIFALAAAAQMVAEENNKDDISAEVLVIRCLVSLWH